MRNILNSKLILLLFLCGILYGFRNSKDSVPIYFSEYGITIRTVPKFGDTLNYNKSSKEDFKFVFFDNKGKCYCERYVNKKLYEKGYYENSLDTLKRYVSGRYSNGKSSSIEVQEYFQPLKNGEWNVYKGEGKTKEVYLIGILQ